MLGVYCGNTSGIGTAGSFTHGNTQGAISYNGKSGSPGAKAACENACGNINAHMCTAHEMSISRQLNISIGSNLWYSSYSFGFQSGNDNTDCAGWSDGTGGTRGPKAYPTPGLPGNDFCNATLSIACCL